MLCIHSFTKIPARLKASLFPTENCTRVKPLYQREAGVNKFKSIVDPLIEDKKRSLHKLATACSRNIIHWQLLSAKGIRFQKENT